VSHCGTTVPIATRNYDVSELGMNSRGDVRTAYEFKDIFDDTGVSHRPYRCPFCEVPYEDRCIVTECVKAPHFKLPNGTTHRGICDGEPESAPSTQPASRPVREVVGELDVPEALVPRRPPGGSARPAAPSSALRRPRRKLVADETPWQASERLPASSHRRCYEPSSWLTSAS
jgi:hypothetical protein